MGRVLTISEESKQPLFSINMDVFEESVARSKKIWGGSSNKPPIKL